MKKLFIGFIIGFVATSVAGQKSAIQQERTVPANCERSQITLNAIHQLAQEGNIIIISRLGRKESSKFLHRVRLNIVKNYLETAWKRSPKTIILAKGEKAGGLGILEFYVKGELIYTLAAKTKKNIPTFCKGIY